MSPVTKHRYLELDGLRGIAALAIFFFHSQEFWAGAPFSAFKIGYLFVDLFFVLSGIVLSYTYEQRISSREIGFGGFFKARVARIGPLHWAVLFFMVIANAIIYRYSIGNRPMISWDWSWQGLVLSALLLQNSGVYPVGTWNAVAWSISSEMIVNVLWFFLVLQRKASTAVLLALAAVSSVLLFAGYGVLHKMQAGASAENVYGFLNGGVLRCVIGFSFGILIYRHVLRGRRHAELPAWLANSLTAAALAFLFLANSNWGKPGWFGADYAVILVAFPVLVIGALCKGSILARVMRSAPLVWMGDLSYALYLVHLPLFMCIPFFLEVTGFAGRGMTLGTVYTACVFVVVVLAHRYIEQPARGAIRRMGSRPSAGASAA